MPPSPLVEPSTTSVAHGAAVEEGRHPPHLAAKQAVHRRIRQCRRPVLVIARRRRHPHSRRMGQIGRPAIARARLAAVVRHRRRPIPRHAVQTLLVLPLATPTAETVDLRRRRKSCRHREVHAVLARSLRGRRLGLPVLVGTRPRRRPQPQQFRPVPATRAGARAGARGQPGRPPRGWRG